jgi:Holliday junction DNA helicase RuvA
VLALFGFSSYDELKAFESLITVSGVGPKLALAILSNLSPDALRAAIAAGNVDVLTSISGIGKRTAGRIVVELRGKLGPVSAEGPALPAAEGGELVSALTSLGYTAGQIQTALRSLPGDPSLSLEDRIILALRYLAPQ